MEIIMGADSSSSEITMDIIFLAIYCVFVLVNILAITKFSNRRELLSIFIMITSLVALLRKLINFFQF